MENDYIIVQDSDGLIVNMVVWDGEATWTPPEGTTAYPAPEDAVIGDSYVDGKLVKAPPPPEAKPGPK